MTRSGVPGSTFGDDAEAYDRFRPSSPDDAVDWLIPPNARDVLDLGAGTGKLTGTLIMKQLHVVAVDHDDRMLHVLRQRYPDVETHAAPAESLPLATESVDAVLVADAWHWFEPRTAAAEAVRVLRPDGWLGLLWHEPDAESGWALDVAQLDPNHHQRYDEDRDRVGLPGVRQEAKSFRWDWRITPEHLRAVLATRTAFTRLDPDDRDARLAEAEAIAQRVAERSGDRQVRWPHTTYAVRCFVRSSAG